MSTRLLNYTLDLLSIKLLQNHKNIEELSKAIKCQIKRVKK